VLIHVTRDASTGPLTVSGTLVDYSAGGAMTPLGVNAQLFNESLPDVLTNQIFLQIPKSALNLTADDVPVDVVSQNAAGVQDTASLVFDADLYQDEPVLNLTQVSAFVNDPVPFTVQRMNPNSPFVLKLGNQQVFSGTLDSTGAFSGTFTVPAIP